MAMNWNPLPKDLEHRAGEGMHVEGEAGAWAEKIPPVGGRGPVPRLLGHPGKCTLDLARPQASSAPKVSEPVTL